MDDDLLIVISESPSVTLTITRVPTHLRYLDQINNLILEEMDLYQPGFRTERIKLSENSAVKIKAFSARQPDTRVSDYLILHDGNLYGLLFAVQPKDNWDEYQHLIDKVVSSFQFLPEPLDDVNLGKLDPDR
jgi:hypothetical protein